MQNLNGDPKLITSMNGGNFAVNGDANVQFNVVSGGKQGINANQYQGVPTVRPIFIRKVAQPVTQ